MWWFGSASLGPADSTRACCSCAPQPPPPKTHADIDDRALRPKRRRGRDPSGKGTSMTACSGNDTPNDGETPAVPTLALCGGLSGVFLDSGLLPELLADLDRSSERAATIARWSELLEAAGFDGRAIDPDASPVPQRPATLAAEGAWRLAERAGFIPSGTLTEPGREVATFARLPLPGRHESRCSPQASSPLWLARVACRSLRCCARRREASGPPGTSGCGECPGLVHVEVGAIVYWACVDAERADTLVGDALVASRFECMLGRPTRANTRVVAPTASVPVRC